MKLEDQVISLELSKKLKELGVKQESLFYWYKQFDNTVSDIFRPTIWRVEQDFELDHNFAISTVAKTGQGNDIWEVYSAFTVAELGEMLPNYVSIGFAGGGRKSERADYVVVENQNSRELWIKNPNREVGINWKEVRDRNMANALAKMLIYLLENKLT